MAERPMENDNDRIIAKLRADAHLQKTARIVAIAYQPTMDFINRKTGFQPRVITGGNPDRDSKT